MASASGVSAERPSATTAAATSPWAIVAAWVPGSRAAAAARMERAVGSSTGGAASPRGRASWRSWAWTSCHSRTRR